MITLEDWEKIPAGEIVRIVTTKYHNTTAEGNPELTFVVKKGVVDEGLGDWAIYYHYSNREIQWIAEYGEKLASKSRIQLIFPCDPDVFSLYRL